MALVFVLDREFVANNQLNVNNLFVNYKAKETLLIEVLIILKSVLEFFFQKFVKRLDVLAEELPIVMVLEDLIRREKRVFFELDIDRQVDDVFWVDRSEFLLH